MLENETIDRLFIIYSVKAFVHSIMKNEKGIYQKQKTNENTFNESSSHFVLNKRSTKMKRGSNSH